MNRAKSKACRLIIMPTKGLEGISWHVFSFPTLYLFLPFEM